MNKLSKRDIRALKIGAVCVVAILVFLSATWWRDHWVKVRGETAKTKKQLKDIRADKTRQAGFMSIVPVFEMPVTEEKQKFLFRDKLNEQIKKAGIKSKPLQVLSTVKSPQAGYKLLRLKCSTKCKFAQVLDLLARLNDNPYLVGVEEIRIKCDPKKRQDVDLDLTVSTFVKEVRPVRPRK
jgi:hypothetical protein